MTDKQFEQIECLSKKLWGDINNGYEYSMVTYSEFLGIVTEVWERLQEETELSQSEVTKISDQEEPVSENLEDAEDKFVKSYTKGGTKQSWLKEGYIAGAQWADLHPRKGLVDIEKACEWLKNTEIGTFPYKLIEEFRKAMEE